MNRISSITILAALAASGFAAAAPAYTTPVGYVTETLKSGQINLIGLTLQTPVITSGILDAKSSSAVGDNESNFTTLLSSGSTYILELQNGTIQEITSWSGSQLTTPQDVSSYVTTGTTTFKVRKAPTLSDVFGVNNTAGLQATDAFDPQQADLIYIPNSSGGFDRYFYSSLAGTTGWFNASNFAVSSNVPIVYTDGILIYRKGSDLALKLSGVVKTQATVLALTSGQYNYVGGIYPVGSTLLSTGLQNSIAGTDAFDPNLADIVYVPDGNGGYKRYFYSTSSAAVGWFNAADFSVSDTIPVTSGIIILRRGASTNATLSPPSNYSSLN